MAQRRIEEMFKFLGLKYDLPWYVIEEVYQSQFKKTAEEMKLLEFPIIKLPGLGKFVPSKDKLSKIDYTEKRLRLINKQNKINDSAGKGNTTNN